MLVRFLTPKNCDMKSGSSQTNHFLVSGYSFNQPSDVSVLLVWKLRALPNQSPSISVQMAPPISVSLQWVPVEPAPSRTGGRSFEPEPSRTRLLAPTGGLRAGRGVWSGLGSSNPVLSHRCAVVPVSPTDHGGWSLSTFVLSFDDEYLRVQPRCIWKECDAQTV